MRKGRLLSPQVSTGLAALLMFGLFVASVVWLHRLADVDSPTLGISIWGEKAATEDRVKRALESTLLHEPLTTWLVSDAKITGKIVAKDDTYASAWKSLAAVAEALTSEASRGLLARLWIGELLSRKDGIHNWARTAVTTESGPERTAITGAYTETLRVVLDRWLVTLMPSSRVELLLSDGSAKAAAVEGKTPVIADLVSDIHNRSKTFLTDQRFNKEIEKILGDDLDPLHAQSSIASSVQKDFAARWMWIIVASLFFTLGVSATCGAVPRLVSCVEKKHRWLVLGASFGTALLGAWVGRRSLAEIGPPFLSRPVRALESAYGIGLEPTVVLLNMVAAIAIVMLLITAGASFLIPTRDLNHLDKQFGTLRWVFHTATLVLVAGVLETYALTHWPTALMIEPAAALVEGGAQVASLAVGAALSTLLLLFYVPGAVVLREEARVRRVATTDEKTKTEIDATVTTHGFDTSASKIVATFAQLLLPLIITVPLGGVVQLLN